MTDISPNSGNLRPHPLAVALAERLRALERPRILEIGTGSGRNRIALAKAGFAVDSYDDVPERTEYYDAALSTHALLHGMPYDIAGRLERIAASLKPGGLLYATFASRRDARFGKGLALSSHTFAAQDGDEAGVAHTYFSRTQLRDFVERDFEIESLDEVDVERIAGSWAHARPIEGQVHFFLVARNRRVDA